MITRYLVLAALCLTAAGQTTLPGTQPLTFTGDEATAMVEDIHSYLDRETAASVAERAALWNSNIIANRVRFQKMIGAVDSRIAVTALEYEATTSQAAEIAAGTAYRVYAVHWPVFDDLTAEGLLLDPTAPPKARIVAIPDADWSPEMLAGLAPGVPARAQFARRLAESGCQVLIPVLIDRADTWSGVPWAKMTNQPHREWIYRMAYEVGRHVIGYEVEKVLAGVDWFAAENEKQPVPIGVAGYGEGGLLAFYSAALDPRIQTVLVSGYFQSRKEVWKEPIYRDLWGLLREFGDAEIARMIAPRSLIVEACRFPEVSGPPPATKSRKGAAPGIITTPPLAEVEREAERAHVPVIVSEGGQGPPGSDTAVAALLRPLGIKIRMPLPDGTALRDRRINFDPAARLHRQFDEMVGHTQAIVRASGRQRAAFWAKADTSSLEAWHTSTKPMRQSIWNEVIGRMPDPSVPANPRTRLIFDEPRYRGYEVMLDVWPGIFAYGILLVPKDIRPGERRPVVVCQHGLEGRPRDVADPHIDSHFYHRFGVRLAEEGFVTFSPQNPYLGMDRFREIQRKGHPLKLSLFSFILGQHQRILEWLGGLPFVDRARIGFYGVSYGGTTAVRVPPLLDGYALSICAADFNESVWKNTSVTSSYSQLLTQEYDMLEFNFANVVNYSDLANLMAPRPFMVERGHLDNVAPDEWVAYEYAKVGRFYAKMGIPDRTAIEFFQGPHTTNGVGTFEFLKKQLHWPE